MKQEIDRIKSDVETIQRAMGLVALPEREWAGWLKRDKWLNLWWCLPGIMLIASSFLPAGRHADRFFGLVLIQWTGILIAATMASMFWMHIRKTTANDGRPYSLIREYKRFWGIDAQGIWAGSALILEFLLYFAWAWHFRISAVAFCSGLFILGGSTYLVLAMISRIWLFFGVAIPVLAYGLFATMLPDSRMRGIPLGIMLIAVALSCYTIQVWQIRQIEHQNESH